MLNTIVIFLSTIVDMEIGVEGLIIIVLTLAGIYFLHQHYINEGLINIKSDVDDREYTVQIKKDAKEAADLIAKIRQRLVLLVDHLAKVYGSGDARVAMLKKNFQPERLKEGVDTPGYTSYSINKGEQIVLCLRTNDKLVDINTMMFVVLHELAHLSTESIGHTDEFWNNFRWILEEAINIGIYVKQDFKKENVEYCGMTITSSPLDK
jgi:predicted metal-dependent hydrolase